MTDITTAISYSGGKDSTALLLHAIETLGKDNFIAVYQDTGFEHSSHYEYLDYIKNKTGVRLEIVKSEKYNGMFDLVEKKMALPNAFSRFCTDELKQKPFKEWLRKNKQIKTVLLGIRAEESKKRKERYSDLTDGFPLSMYPVYGKREFSDVMCYVPLVEWTEQDVWDIHDKYDIKPNPQYSAGASRVGCYPCILGADKSWKIAWNTKEGKANILKLAELEEKVQEHRGLSKAGKQRTFRREESLRDFIKRLELEDTQEDMFGNDTELSCSWCQS